MNLRLLQYRIARADIVIFLDTPRYICFWRIFKRLIKHYGSATPYSAHGCPEGLSREFMTFLKWVWDFKKQYRPQVIQALDGLEKQKYHILTSQHDIDRFVDTIAPK